MVLLNTKQSFGITGLVAQKRLEEIGIATNKNMLPGDNETPNTTSGLRIGFSALTTRGCTKKDAIKIADIIYVYLKLYDYLRLSKAKQIKKMVKQIVKKMKKV